MKFQIDNEETEDHWLVLIGEGGWRKAIVRFDGCIHYDRYHNYPYVKGEDPPESQVIDYLHICSIDEEIENLKAIRAMALDFFGPDWDR